MSILKQKDVVPIIAKIVKSHIDNKTARNSIRGFIKRAIDKGSLRKISHNVFDHDELWRWAIGKWSILENHQAIPSVPKINKASAQGNLPSLSSSATLLNIPPPSQLEEGHKSHQLKHIETMAENASLKERNAELEPLKIKKDALRNKSSAAGKKGGRGNKK